MKKCLGEQMKNILTVIRKNKVIYRNVCLQNLKREERYKEVEKEDMIL